MTELPQPDGSFFGDYFVNTGDYTADQMRDYGRAVRLEALEEAAKVCDAECNPEPYSNVSQYESGGYSTAEFLAEAIRALAGEKT